MKKIGLLLLLWVFSAIASAQEDQLIVWVNDGQDIHAIASDTRYSGRITLVDSTSDKLFGLFSPKPGVDLHNVQADMLLDFRIRKAEDNALVAMPKGEASKGSTVASIGNRSTLYAMNTKLLQQIKFNPSWANAPGREVRVAVLDTGMSAQRPEIWAKTVASLNIIEPGEPAYDRPRNHNTNNNGLTDEGTGHGSMVTGIIDQIAPLAKLIVVRAADSDGISNAWFLIKGLSFAVQHRAEVVNISLGSEDRIPALQDVLEWCEVEKGIVIVAPIGNDNRRMTLFPAESSHVICVTGVDDEDEKASFSNWDSDAVVSAPATGIRSYWWDGKLAVWDGTSFAAPLVSGAIADCLRRRRPLSAWKVRPLLERFGDNIDGSNWNYDGKLGLRLNITRIEVGLRRMR